MTVYTLVVVVLLAGNGATGSIAATSRPIRIARRRPPKAAHDAAERAMGVTRCRHALRPLRIQAARQAEGLT
jgi:hypothetical protein